MSSRRRNGRTGVTIPKRVGDDAEVNYAKPAPPDFGPLARDRIPVRAMKRADLGGLVRIDRRVTEADRSGYLESKLNEALNESGVRVSLVAELDGQPVGFIMARVDFGEFGTIDPVAVLDTIGVDPDYRNVGIGRALLSQLLANLGSLRVERIRSEVAWNEHELLGFLERCGFGVSQRLCIQYVL
jgi:ribosomal protein S18 acetylase RimI-like enzyme